MKNQAQEQVFLGGSCDPTTWRKDIVMPALAAAGVSYYNPQVANYDELDAAYKAQGIAGGIVAVEAEAKANCPILLFVIDNQTRAIASILEATEYICTGRTVVLRICDNIADGTVIDGEAITGRQLKDLNRARSYLKDVAARHRAPVFSRIDEAVAEVVRLAKQS